MSSTDLRVRIDDHEMAVETADGTVHVLPLGPCSLVGGALAGGDPPPPANLTNALGLVHDHLDDLLIADPTIAAVASIVITGRHTDTLACVEIGTTACPSRHELTREATDEVFRVLACEPRDDRRHNPGLPGDQIDTVIGTCCVVLAIMRRLDRSAVFVERHIEQPGR